MSPLRLPALFLIYTYFNSKSCDYETCQYLLPRLIILISIPKGAIMSIIEFVTVELAMHFNSKRCDYECSRQSTEVSRCNFNSKRCDYEDGKEPWFDKTTMTISIPKGAIMRVHLLV